MLSYQKKSLFDCNKTKIKGIQKYRKIFIFDKLKPSLLPLLEVVYLKYEMYFLDLVFGL